MRKSWGVLFCVFVFCAATACADTIVQRDGASYSGQCMGPNSGQIAFTDGQGIEYKFPASDVQSLAFGRIQDTVTLRNGKIYAGQYNGPEYVAFRDGQGIDYNFPVRDLETIIFIQNSAPPAATTGVAVVIPRGTEIVVRNDETIDSENSSTGQLFSAVVSEDVPDSSGGIAIPRGTRARLVVRNITSGGTVHSPELALDLFSVDMGGKE
ncbi:MAG: hypothetical protein WAK48_29045 [Candidatus Acidiferrum sp.]|jgi:hypothetical protein